MPAEIVLPINSSADIDKSLYFFIWGAQRSGSKEVKDEFSAVIGRADHFICRVDNPLLRRPLE
jgi:hypothetical protein